MLRSLMTGLSVLVASALSTSMAAEPAAAPARGDATLRVMTFNIRYGTAKDGPDHWDKRRELLADTVRKFDPDLLGTQETLLEQAEYLAEKFPGYDWLGVGRDDGKRKGESVAIFWKKGRFEKEGGGHFWLSETPDVPASKSWDTSLTRMATWVKLRDKKAEGPASQFVWLNTHFDHMGKQARLESGKVIRAWLRKNAADLPVVVTGDFNTDAGSAPFKALVGEGDAPQLTDAYGKLHPQRGPEEGTHHAFKGGRTGTRIDWILYSKPYDVVEAAIDHTNDNGRYPSDHYPVTAVLRVQR